MAASSVPHFTGQAIVWTQFGYDALGRTTLKRHPDATTRTWAFAPGLVTLTDERGSVKRQYQDGYGRLSRVEEVNGGATYVTTYAYDGAGALLQVTNHAGTVTTNTYDLLGRKTQMQDPNMGTWTYVYDAAGSLTSQTDAKTQTLTFFYDQVGRMTKRAMGPSEKFLKSGIGRAGGVYHRPTGLNLHLDYQSYPGHPEPGWHLNVGKGGKTIHMPVSDTLVPDSWRYPSR